jgi:hypothetical protein
MGTSEDEMRQQREESAGASVDAQGERFLADGRHRRTPSSSGPRSSSGSELGGGGGVGGAATIAAAATVVVLRRFADGIARETRRGGSAAFDAAAAVFPRRPALPTRFRRAKLATTPKTLRMREAIALVAERVDRGARDDV